MNTISTTLNLSSLHLEHRPKVTVGFDKAKASIGRAAYYMAIDRRKRYFETEEERDKAALTQEAMHEFGVGRITISVKEQVELREMKRLHGSRPQSLLDIYKLGLATLPQDDVPLKDLARQFKVMKEAQVKAGALKKNSCGQQLDALNALMKRFGEGLASDLRNPAFEEWLMSLPHSPAGRWSFSKALGVFLNWAVDKKKALKESTPLSTFAEPPSALIAVTARNRRCRSEDFAWRRSCKCTSVTPPSKTGKRTFPRTRLSGPQAEVRSPYKTTAQGGWFRPSRT